MSQSAFSGIVLFPGPPVNRHRRDAAALRHPGKLHRIDTGIIESLSEFYGYRFMKLLTIEVRIASASFWIFHQSRAFAIVYNLRDRTAHIDINDIIRTFFQPERHIAHDIGIRTEKLYGYRTLFFPYRQDWFPYSCYYKEVPWR